MLTFPLGLRGTGQLTMRFRMLADRELRRSRRTVLYSLHQIKIHVIQPQLLQTLIQTSFRVSVVSRPQLGGHEQLFPVDPRLFDPLADFLLVLVHEGAIDVTVAAFNGGLDGLGDFTGTGYRVEQSIS